MKLTPDNDHFVEILWEGIYNNRLTIESKDFPKGARMDIETTCTGIAIKVYKLYPTSTEVKNTHAAYNAALEAQRLEITGEAS